MIRTGRFVIKKVGDGYMYELQASNYSSIAESPVYTTLESAKRSIRSVMEHAATVPVQDNTVADSAKYSNPKFEIFRLESYFFFRYRAGNGKRTISSQVYTSKEGCKNGVASVQTNIADAVVCIETPDGIISMEEYAALEEKRIAEGGTPTILDPNGEIDFDTPDVEVEESERSTRPGRFVIHPDDKGFHYELLAANNHPIALSPTYSTLDSAKRSIHSIKEYASGVPVQDNTLEKIEKQSNPKFEIFSEGEEFIFRFRAKNGKQTIASQLYVTKEGCRHGIDSVQKHVRNAEVYIDSEDGCIPIEEYTAIRVAIFNASVFSKKTKPTTATETEATSIEVEPVVEEQTPVVEEVKETATPVVPAKEPEETPVAQAEEPVAEVVEEPVAETVEEPVAETVEEPVAETVEEPVAETVEEPVAETVEEPVAETVEEPISEVTEEPSEEPVYEEITEEPVAETDYAEPVEEPIAEDSYAGTELDESTYEQYEDASYDDEQSYKEKAPVQSPSATKKPGFVNFLSRLFLGK